ncbi:hypothetical protein [Glycomyces harbinensis]|uniref:DUF4351 domain-containing protein n=1 Tax=Glycomyces harbinensis TaxID=58114 RepID=A0A1G6V397_9ACTN|nr:hypothetical protein [Glycomyces harbinensis]SDD47406.1 hypothetical protein SAMN05216270_104157 [Glycomyces harbinensis]
MARDGLTPQHEAILEVARMNPADTLELLRIAGIHYDPKELTDARTDSENANRRFPRERRIDLVARLVMDGGPILVPIEAHRRNNQNPAKLVAKARRKWAADVAVLFEDYHCPVIMLVISDCDEVAAEARQPIELGPGSRVVPVSIGPAQVRVITDPVAPDANPGTAMLSAIFHGNGPDRVAVLNALDQVLATIDKEEAGRRVGVVFTALNEESAKVLEAIMTTTKFEYHSEWTDGLRKEGREQGREQGREEGQLKQARKSLLAVLKRRSMPVTSETQKFVESSGDLDQLQAWLVAAATADSLDEVFGVDPDVQQMLYGDN